MGFAFLPSIRCFCFVLCVCVLYIYLIYLLFIDEGAEFGCTEFLDSGTGKLERVEICVFPVSFFVCYVK